MAKTTPNEATYEPLVADEVAHVFETVEPVCKNILNMISVAGIRTIALALDQDARHGGRPCPRRLPLRHPRNHRELV